MKDLFDFTAGTSTGSIIAAGIATPDNIKTNNMTKYKTPDLKKFPNGGYPPLYSADALINIYKEKNK